MNKIYINILLLFLFFNLQAQNNKFYSTTGTEFIFQFADVQKNNIDISTRLRFSLFYHFEQHYHYDFQNIGLFTGFGIRNIGFTTAGERLFDDQGNVSESDLKIKRRVYAVGVPLAIKFGNLDDRFYLFSGGELEIPFHYKQKIFIDGKKESKKTDWFSNRTNWYLPSIFAGIQFPSGVNIRFRYYLKDLIKKDYVFDQSAYFSDLDENFQKNRMFHISVSYHMINSKIKNTIKQKEDIQFTDL